MDYAVVTILFVAFVVAAILVSIGSAKLARERLAGLKRLAASRGWRFDPEDSYSYADEFPFELFHHGDEKRAYNTIWGDIPVAGQSIRVRAGDFSYKVTTSTGKTTTTSTHVFSYLLLRLPFAYVPDLEVRREGLLDKMSQLMGFEDIDFESEEFSRKFVVKCRDKKFAYDVVTPRMMEMLLASEWAGIAISNGWVCMTGGTSVWQPDQFHDAVRFAEAFFGLWPGFVYEALSARGVHG